MELPKEKIKVIFLDIDGVMNSEIFYRKRFHHWNRKTSRVWWKIKKFFTPPKKQTLEYKENPEHYKFEFRFGRLKSETCSQKWEWLTEFCNENNIKICISSVWKHNFAHCNDLYPVYTESINDEGWERAFDRLGFNAGIYVGITDGPRRTERGQEIKEWLEKHPEVIDYAIIDDDSDMLPEQRDKFFHIDSWWGLSPTILYRIKMRFKLNESKR